MCAIITSFHFYFYELYHSYIESGWSFMLSACFKVYVTFHHCRNKNIVLSYYILPYKYTA